MCKLPKSDGHEEGQKREKEQPPPRIGQSLPVQSATERAQIGGSRCSPPVITLNGSRKTDRLSSTEEQFSWDESDADTDTDCVADVQSEVRICFVWSE